MIEARATTFECPTDEIAAYIDGELSAARELELDLHFAACSPCQRSLNEQKQFLCRLESSLKQDRDLELPPDFAKVVVVNAESTVSGLRRPRERFNALFICVALGLFGLFALGADTRVIRAVIDQVGIVGAFFGRIIYSVSVGIVVILRSIAAPLPGETILGAALFAMCLFLLVVSLGVLRLRRA
jgi:hypothetical protein